MHPKADEAKRAEYKQAIAQHETEGNKIVYIDESGFYGDAHRTHAYSLKSQRPYCLYNWEKKQRTNAIGASINGQLITACLFDCSINAEIFYAWLTQDLLPKLQGDEVVVIDNASIHKRQDIINAIKHKGCKLLWLPLYSPDFNPIEHIWAHAKSLRKKFNCSIDVLFKYYLQ